MEKCTFTYSKFYLVDEVERHVRSSINYIVLYPNIDNFCFVADSLVAAQSTRNTIIIIIVVTISGFIIIVGAIISALLFWRSQRYKKLLLLEVHKSKILHPSIGFEKL